MNAKETERAVGELSIRELIVAPRYVALPGVALPVYVNPDHVSAIVAQPTKTTQDTTGRVVTHVTVVTLLNGDKVTLEADTDAVLAALEPPAPIAKYEP